MDAKGKRTPWARPAGGPGNLKVLGIFKSQFTASGPGQVKINVNVIVLGDWKECERHGWGLNKCVVQ
jgi:hypothetical protein